MPDLKSQAAWEKAVVVIAANAAAAIRVLDRLVIAGSSRIGRPPIGRGSIREPIGASEKYRSPIGSIAEMHRRRRERGWSAHSAPLSNPEPPGISFLKQSQRNWCRSRPYQSGPGPTAKMAKGDHDMFKSSKNSHPLLAVLAIASIFAAAPAFAGECPADKMKPN